MVYFFGGFTLEKRALKWYSIRVFFYLKTQGKETRAWTETDLIMTYI